MSTVRVDDVDVGKVVLDSESLGFEKLCLSVGVSNDSRALGSSSLVYLPIEGL